MTALMITHGDKGYPHMAVFMAANPDVVAHVAVSPETGESKHELWKNSDRFLTEWWRANRDQVEGDVVAIMEWDTYVSIPLPLLPDDLDLASRICQPRELADMPFPKTAGLLSFGFFLCRRWVLDAVAKPEWDAARAMSIQNETRFPSIALSEGAKLGRIQLPFVYCKKQIPVTIPGIYHPCKP